MFGDERPRLRVVVVLRVREYRILLWRLASLCLVAQVCRTRASSEEGPAEFSIQFHSSLGRSWARRLVSRVVEGTCMLARRTRCLGVEGYLDLGHWIAKSVDLSPLHDQGE